MNSARLFFSLMIAAFCCFINAAAEPILTTGAPPFPLKKCDPQKGPLPFAPVPQELNDHPQLLEAFLESVNPRYGSEYSTVIRGETRHFPGFKGISAAYKKWCTAYGVRWDWAFIQMLHETDFLRYTGSVPPDHYNFGGIAAVTSTAKGENFKMMARGVKAHCQHLAAYALIDLPKVKCNDDEINNLHCLEAQRTLNVITSTIQSNVCQQFGRSAQFDELGPDDVGPCTERTFAVDGIPKVIRDCPNDLVQWASGPNAVGYARMLEKHYNNFSKRRAQCAGILDELSNATSSNVENADRNDGRSRDGHAAVARQTLSGCIAMPQQEYCAWGSSFGISATRCTNQ